MRSGIISVVGRPNVGKSSLINALVGEKVTIVSDKAQTTRHAIRAIYSTDEEQLVFVDTPGIHKPRTKLGLRLNEVANDALDGVDVVVFVIDGHSGLGSGDEFIAKQLPKSTFCVVNKADRCTKAMMAETLTKASQFEFSEFFPISALTSEGIEEFRSSLIEMMPEGPPLFPTDEVREMPDEMWVAELVREELLKVAEEELPHSIATRVTEWEWPRIRCEILVERDSQKGIVIGKGGAILKQVGINARAQLPEGVFLELFVKVEKNWQSRPDSIERLGY